MRERDGELLKAAPVNCALDIDRELQMTKCALDRELPGRGHAHENRVFCRCECFSCIWAEGTWLIQPPKKNVRIQQDSHLRLREDRPSKESRRSAGRGSSKFGEIQILPRKNPPFRRLAGAGRKGTSFAFGWPALAMTISSPAAARSTSSERWVFAS